MKKHIIITFILFIFNTNYILGSPKNNSTTKIFFSHIYGQTPVDCVYIGMCTAHIGAKSIYNHHNWNNQSVGIQYKSIYAATIKNSHSTRCYIIGITRDWMKFHTSKNTWLSFGYRLGGIYGYDGRLADFAEKYPVLPIYQLCSQFQYKRLRLEISYFRDLLSGYLTIVYNEY